MCITALRGMDKNKKEHEKKRDKRGKRKNWGSVPLPLSAPRRALGGCHYVQVWDAGGAGGWGPS